MIYVNIKTNLCLFNEVWPEFLPCLPNVGDEIESMTRRTNGWILALKVVAIRWKQMNDNTYYPEIELSLIQSMWSLRDFYNWYAPIVGKSPSYFI